MPQCPDIVKNLHTDLKNNSSSQNETESDTPKPKAGELYGAIFDAVEKTAASLLEPFPHTIRAFELRPGVKQPYIEHGGECQTVGIEKIRQLILAYTRKELFDLKDYCFTSTQAQGAAAYWYDLTPCADKPRAFLMQGDKGRCFRRVPFKIEPNLGSTRTPLFNELLGRMKSNVEPLKAFIWSIFIPGSYCQQYLWIRGEGNDGKGALTRTLLKLAGSVGIVQNTAPWKGNKHWALPFIDMRLVVFPDFKDGSSMDNGILKSLVCGDRIYVDPKGPQGYMVELMCKVIFCSNDMPNLTGSKADLRRIILVEIESTDAFDEHYEGNLWAELPYFLDDCRIAYEKLCPVNQPICTDEESAAILQAEQDDKDGDLHSFFAQNFVRDANAEITPADYQQRAIDWGERHPQFLRRFKAWLKLEGFEAKHDQKRSRKRFIKGLKLRPYPLPAPKGTEQGTPF